MFAFAWLLPAWRGYAVLASDYRLFGRLLLTAALALELLFLLDFSRQIRSNAGGASESFGTSLGRQWLVAGRLAAARRANPDLRVEIKVDRWRDRPEMLRTLLRLADGTELPPAGEYVGAVLLPSRSGCGIDLIFLEKPVEH